MVMNKAMFITTAMTSLMMNMASFNRILMTLLILYGLVRADNGTTAAGGTVKVEFMHSYINAGKTFIFTGINSTMFTHNAPLAPPDGIWGELVPFSPLDACRPLQASNYTRMSGNQIQFTTVGPYPHVVALVARGNCTFEEKFDFVDNVPNVIGLLMYDYEDGGNLSNDIEISTFRMTTIPGFLVDYKTGQELLQQVNQMRSEDQEQKKPEEPFWIKVTLQYVSFSGPIQSILQFTLLFVMALLGIAFVSSVYMHYHIYRLQQRLGQHRLANARNAIVIDEAFLEKLPVKKYQGDTHGGGIEKTIVEGAKGVTGAKGITDAAGIATEAMASTSQPSFDLRAPVEDEGIIHAHAPPNETCPICLDEFVHAEVLNELPCGHFYHKSCIGPWLLNRSPECPMCKEDVRNAYIPQPDPIDMETAGKTWLAQVKGWFKKSFCCCRNQNTLENQNPPATMTEVRIVTPISTVEQHRSRDGTLQQVPLYETSATIATTPNPN